MPRISVILPFYNASATLDRALQSIHLQDMDDFECIMVDNNSTDGSLQIAEEWQQMDSKFRMITERQQGVMFASNAGCREAKGAYLARMDADDRATPGRLRLQSQFLDDHPGYGAVAGLVSHVGDPKTTGGFKRFVEWSNTLVSYKDIFNRRFIEAPVVNPSAMWRRETMEKYGLYLSGEFPEDYEMWLRWLHEGVKIAKVPEVVLEWCDSPGRLTRTHPIYSDAAFYRIKSQYLARWLTEKNPFHPEVWVWGASRISRRRARVLENEGIRIRHYVDTKRGRQLEKQVVYYEEIPSAGEGFILTYIRQMDNRDKIREFLEGKGYREGVDYLLVS